MNTEGKKYSIEQYLSVLPTQTYNCEPFGIKIMPCNTDAWSVCWYSHFSNKHDDRIPVFIGNTAQDALAKAYDWLSDDMPELVKQLPPSPAAQWQKEAEEIKKSILSVHSKENAVQGGLHYTGFERGVDEALKLILSQHAAHLAQLQGEVDDICKLIEDDIQHWYPQKDVIRPAITRLRTITQTKMKGE